MTQSLAVLLLFGAAFATAQQQPKQPDTTAPPPKIVSTITTESMMSLIQGMGFPCAREKDKDGKPTRFFNFKSQGHEVIATVLTNVTAYLASRYTNDLKVTTERLNKWNSQESLSTAYIEDDGTVVVGTPIIVVSGVTEEHIQDLVTEFGDTIPRFLQFLRDTPQKPETPKP